MTDWLTRKNLAYVFTLVFLLLALVYVYVIVPIEKDRDSLQQQVQQKETQYKAMGTRKSGFSNLAPAVQIQLSALRNQIPEEPRTDDLLRLLRSLEAITQTSLPTYTISTGMGATAGAAGASASSSATAASPTPSPSPSKAAGTSDLSLKDDGSTSSGLANPNGSGSANGSTASGTSLVQPIRLNISLKADYDQIIRFLQEAQSFSRLITVENVNLQIPTSVPVKVNPDGKDVICTATLVAYDAPNLKELFKNPLPVEYSQPEGDRSNPL